MERRCSKCLAFKPIDQFGNDKRGKDGKSYRCKKCASSAANAHYAANREIGIQKRKEYYHSHKEENSIKCRAYRETHKEQLKVKQREWIEANKHTQKARDHAKYLKRKDAVLKRCREYVIENPEKSSARKKAYYRANKPKIRAQIQEWYVNKKKTDLGFRMLCNLRRRLAHVIAGETKSARTIELLGCDIPTFMAHIESKFTQGMSWRNYGKWQVDHVVPFFAHDMATEEGQRASFHYMNTQPLWREHNQSKGKRFNSASVTASNPVPTPPQSGSFPAQPQPLSRG